MQWLIIVCIIIHGNLANNGKKHFINTNKMHNRTIAIVNHHVNLFSFPFLLTTKCVFTGHRVHRFFFTMSIYRTLHRLPIYRASFFFSSFHSHTDKKRNRKPLNARSTVFVCFMYCLLSTSQRYLKKKIEKQMKTNDIRCLTFALTERKMISCQHSHCIATTQKEFPNCTGLERPKLKRDIKQGNIERTI